MLLFYCSHNKAGQQALFKHVLEHVGNDSRLPPIMKEFRRETDGMTKKDVDLHRDKIERYFIKTLEWGYGSIVEICARHDTIPIWIYVPLPNMGNRRVDPMLANMAKMSGFKVISLERAFDGWNETTLMTDIVNHPNSICRHRDKNALFPMGQIIKSIVSNINVPEEKTMYVALGNPCQNEYVEYRL